MRRVGGRLARRLLLQAAASSEDIAPQRRTQEEMAS
jgi:hypothetical protein